MQSRLQRISARLPTYATYIKQRPRWIFVLVFGRLLLVRSVERLLRADRRSTLRSSIGQAVAVTNPDQVMRDLDEFGVHRGLRLAPGVVDEIVQFAGSTPCTSRIAPLMEFLPSEVASKNKERTRDIIAGYYFERVNECPAIKTVETDPLLNTIATQFIGAPPRHIRTRLWWSFPSSNATDADRHASAQDKYHFDLNDFCTLKFFFYLTDVDLGAGPHCYIERSHRHRALRHQFTLTVGQDEDGLRRYYGSAAFQTVTGPAGTGFAEDPFIFHMGQACTDKPRLILEIEFGPYLMSEGYRYGLLG